MERIGIVFGCFIPLHKGHKHLIEEAIKDNDKVIIAVCGYESDRGKDFIPYSVRLNLMKNKYKDDKNIFVVGVDDKKIELTGKFDNASWKIWADELFYQYSLCPRYSYKVSEFTWYTGELSYVRALSNIYVRDNFKLFGRKKIDISGTKIRENYKNYLNYIDEDFREYLDENIETS